MGTLPIVNRNTFNSEWEHFNSGASPKANAQAMGRNLDIRSGVQKKLELYHFVFVLFRFIHFHSVSFAVFIRVKLQVIHF